MVHAEVPNNPKEYETFLIENKSTIHGDTKWRPWYSICHQTWRENVDECAITLHD